MKTDFLFPVDIHAVKHGDINEWQRDFFWPISDSEYFALSRDVDLLFAGLIADHEGMQSDMFLVAWPVVMELTHFLHAIWVTQSIIALGRTPFWMEWGQWYAHAGNNESFVPDFDVRPALDSLRAAPKPWRGFVGTVKRTVHEFRTNSIRHFPLRFLSSGTTVIYGVPREFISLYMRHLPTWTRCSMPHDWIIHPGRGTFGFVIESLVSEVLSRLGEIASRHEIILRVHHQLYLTAVIIRALTDARAMLDMLAGHSSLPARFILTTPSQPFQRAFAIATRQSGGRVISFTHGGHVGFLNSPTMVHSEFALSDQFVCYTPGSRVLFERIRTARPRIGKNYAEIVSADTLYYRNLVKNKMWRPLPTRLRTLLFVGVPYAPWRKTVGSNLFWPMQLDFELRLVMLLRANGYDVTYKTHPDRISEIQGVFEPYARVVYDGDAQELILQFDGVIFTTMRCTAFPAALCTNRPVVSFLCRDEQPMPFEEPIVTLRKRCHIIETTFDDRNRICFNNDALLTALTATPTEPDMEFVERYFFS
jgi:hypothetical protein